MRKLILILFLFSPVEAQTFKLYPVHNDYPDSKYGSFLRYDKADHFAISALLVTIIPTKKYNLDFWLSVSAGFSWEIRDGLNHKRTGGFSWIDFILGDIAGAMAGVWLKDLCHELGVYVLINKNGISIHF